MSHGHCMKPKEMGKIHSIKQGGPTTENSDINIFKFLVEVPSQHTTSLLAEI